MVFTGNTKIKTSNDSDHTQPDLYRLDVVMEQNRKGGSYDNEPNRVRKVTRNSQI